MLVSCAWRALSQIFSPPFRAVLWKSLALTVVLLALVWLALTRLFSWWLSGYRLGMTDHPGIETYAVLLAGIGLVVGLGYLIPAVSMLVASFFLDDVAEKVERDDYPPIRRARPADRHRAGRGGEIRPDHAGREPHRPALRCSSPASISWPSSWPTPICSGANTSRSRPAASAPCRRWPRLRRRHSGTVLAAGALIAACRRSCPSLNLLTPLFGTALMVHLHKQLTTRALPVPRG